MLLCSPFLSIRGNLYHMCDVRVGTTGFDYDYWQNILYPAKATKDERLTSYVNEFNILEFTTSFSKWPSISQLIRLKRQLPKDFLLNLQAPKNLTHRRWLANPEAWVAKLAGSWHVVKDHRGVLRLSLPESMERDDDRLGYFLSKIPAWIKVAIEFENNTWVCEEVMELLETYNASYVVTSGAWLPCFLRATNDLVYVRLYGPDEKSRPGGSYSDADLYWWKDRVREWQSQGRKVHCFFVNALDGISVLDARRFKQILAG